MREIISIANWASTDRVGSAHGWAIFGKPQEVRALVREYLTIGAHCKVTVRADLCGLKVSYINATNGARVNVRTLLSGLKRLYDFLIVTGRYHTRTQWFMGMPPRSGSNCGNSTGFLSERFVAVTQCHPKVR
jgi:hypothetical protein